MMIVACFIIQGKEKQKMKRKYYRNLADDPETFKCRYPFSKKKKIRTVVTATAKKIYC